ncbi:MAG TPA: hypothetical protein VNW92_04945 [Polyangiaceae bacterium]|jgi:hypothetical protein|nr:hypothetical protein [Polyangiaceae bacterium]
MSRRAFKIPGVTFGLSALGAIVLVSACSKYLSDGPDPAQGGRVDAGPSGFGGNSGCNPLQTLVQSSNATNCPSFVSCEENTCDGSLRACFGQNYRNGDLSGGRCAGLAACIQNCGCGQGCLLGCNPQSDCATCLNSAKQCEDGNCQQERTSCSGIGGSSSFGGSGNGGNGGSGGGALDLAPGVFVNDLALDADTVYFTSGEGLAKVAKAGGTPVGLGGFTQLGGLAGLALDAQRIYVVGGDGSLIAVSKDGTGQQNLSMVMCGGGSGAVALGAGNVFFTTGPYLRVTPLGGGAPLDLAGNVWQAGGPASGARLALDPDNAYYVGSPNMGGQGALFGVARLSPGAPSCMGGINQGTLVATPKGSISALIGDGARLFFTDLTSNGLTQVLVVSALPMPTLAPDAGPATVIDLASLTEGTNNSPNAGNALVSDGTYLYFGGFTGIYRVLIGGPSCPPGALPCGQSELVVPSAMATALAVDDAFLYYGDQNGQNGQNGLKKIAK